MGDDRPFGNHMQLYSQTGHLLKIRPTGEIAGTQEVSDTETHIEASSGGDVSHVRLLGMESNLYACYGSDGELYGEADRANRGTIFIEEFLGSYSTYKSALYPDWYIGIKKNGLPKKGYRTKTGQKAIKFLPRRL